MDRELFEQRKQTLLELMGDKIYVPMKLKELSMLLQVPREERNQLLEVLDALVQEGKVELSKRGKYRLAEETILTGTYVGTSRGYGFVEIPGRPEDLFIPEPYTGGAFHRDTVQAALLPGNTGRRPEGRIVRVLERGIRELVCTFEKNRSYGFALPDNPRFSRDIFIPLEKSKGAVDGHKVLVEITDYGSKNKSPEGQVKEIIGHRNDPGTDILSIACAYELPTEFPERVLNQAERNSRPVSEADCQGRLDLREVVMVTIDGEDAKDLDDAVSLTREGDLWRLGVHIADVSNYVQEGSALDREALKRGTSVYLVDRVIPMLPHTLSNGICSLNQGEDRLALSCLMDIDDKGNIVGHQIAETVIRVDCRMTYTGVNEILTGQEGEAAKAWEAFAPMLLQMNEVAGLLRKKRKTRGSIDFDFPESKITLDENGRPTDIRPYERNAATKLIEDFMLAANETVAEDYFWQELPFVYRTHEKPDPDKIRDLQAFIGNFGYHMRRTGEEVHPKELQKLLASIEDSPEEAMISRMTLRSMKRACYSTQCSGHFGLAASYYCHFTSPIRRYPDLQIHRIIKDNLRGRMNEERISHYQGILDGVAKQSSDMERRADEAERETEKMKKAEYMRQKIGRVYDGVISGLTAWGLYVELPNTVEGLVHVSNLTDDRYYYDEEKHEMTGAGTGRTFCLGQRVRVRVLDADKESRTVDFAIVYKGGDEDGQGIREADSQ